MKKLFAILITAAALCIFGLTASAAGTGSVIPTKTLNKVLDSYRSAIKTGSTYVDLSGYGLSNNNETYSELWMYFLRANSDVGSITFGKYNESYVSFTINKDSSSGKIKGVTLEYDAHFRKEDGSCDTELVKKDQAIINDRFTKSKSLVNRNMTDVEKALLLYDFVISAADYSEPSETDQFGDSVYSKDAYTVTGLLRDGYAICTAYAKLYAILLNEVGVDAITVESKTIRHEWVMVNIDGKWYHCDPTWDDIFSRNNNTIFKEPNNDSWDIGAVGHTYFLKSDEEFKELDHPDWDLSYTVIPDDLDILPASGPSGSFDDMFFSDKNETYRCLSAMNCINGNWYFADLNSNSIIAATVGGEPEAFPLPDNEVPKYSFGFGSDLYVCTDYHIYRFDTLAGNFDPIMELPKDGEKKKVFSEMNIFFDEMTLVTAEYSSDSDFDDAVFDVTKYDMNDLSVMEPIKNESELNDGETVLREETEDNSPIPQVTRPGGSSARETMSDEGRKLVEEAQNAGKRISSLIYLGIAAIFIVFGIVAIILAIKYHKKR